jgi:hypothetical protein
MTTYIQFLPSNVVAPRFTTTFDDDQYTVIVTWNLASQRYFLNIYGSNNNWICTVPLIGTSPGVDIINLNPNVNNNTMEVTVASPYWRPLGQIIKMTIENCQPDDINGSYDCLIIGRNVFTIPMPASMGQVTVLGSASRLINMIEGYFQTSSLVFRNMMFEVRP